jgi:hypothetical protein
MCDAYIRESALSPSAEPELPGHIARVLHKHEVVDPANDTAHWESETYCGRGVTGNPPYSGPS